MASLNEDGTKIQQDTLIHRHVSHAIVRSNYITDEKVEQIDPNLPD